MDAFTMWEACGYPKAIQVNGEIRMGPPLQWFGPDPTWGSEIFISGLPRDCSIDELLSITNSLSPVYIARMKVDFSGQSRGYAFVQYGSREIAIKAARALNGSIMRGNVKIMAKLSVDNRRLQLIGVPIWMSIEDVWTRTARYVPTIKNVFRVDDRILLAFEDHASASQARKILVCTMKKMWGEGVSMEWGEPEEFFQ